MVSLLILNISCFLHCRYNVNVFCRQSYIRRVHAALDVESLVCNLRVCFSPKIAIIMLIH